MVSKLPPRLIPPKEGLKAKTPQKLAGRIVETGDATLAHELHANGYAAVRERHPEAAAEETQEEAATV